MPEGHTIRRYADRHRKVLAGRKVAASSPQGRFTAGARRLSGRELLDVDAHGKHLFYRWKRAETLHVHLGLYGKFKLFRKNPPPPTPGTRLALTTDEVTIYLAGPTVCELIVPSQEEAILARLGPDPLKADTNGNSAEVFIANLQRRRIPIGAAILDQSVIAGIGNIYRAEGLFLTSIHPETPANEVSAAKAAELWDKSVELLERGVTEGRIATLPRVPLGKTAETDRLYVYNRERFPCRVCGGPISTGEMAARSIWWCNTCQAA
ncbi:MAG: DNA-formamidopyrimidine glycosylase family protein [Acidimicrobiia bacterium]|nr:DNA-formamidopyrimidine glycosylase family protein [Acidimicrobiia bacterium]